MYNNITVRCFAKINLQLKILGRRLDNFHEILTVFQSIDLHDILSASLTTAGISLECDDATLPVDGGNLIIQATELFQRRLGKSISVHYCLQKRIPVAAGLGGGSSDAAATLAILNKLEGSPFDKNELAEMASEVGSDVAFFLFGGRAGGRGRGEIVEPLKDTEATLILIAFPYLSVRAAKAYRLFDLTARSQISNISRSIENQEKMPLPDVPWQNDLEQGVFKAFPQIESLKNELLDYGAREAVMCGSGSAIAGKFSNTESAERAASRLRKKGVGVFIATTLSATEIEKEFIIECGE